MSNGLVPKFASSPEDRIAMFLRKNKAINYYLSGILKFKFEPDNETYARAIIVYGMALVI
jgi:hypothetical protein